MFEGIKVVEEFISNIYVKKTDDMTSREIIRFLKNKQGHFYMKNLKILVIGFYNY